jgi:hypothetical protein
MATVIQRNNKWYAQIRRKGHQTVSKTFDTKNEAEEFSKKVEQEMLYGGSDNSTSFLLPVAPIELKKMYAGMLSRSRLNEWDEILSYEEFLDIFYKTGGMCELSGIPFAGGKINNSRARPFFPSIDRINSCKGYTKDNVRFVCCAVNLALNDFGEDVLNQIAFGIVSKLVLQKKGDINGNLQKTGKFLVLSGTTERA